MADIRHFWLSEPLPILQPLPGDRANRGFERLYADLSAPNRPLEDWGKLVGDVPSATAMLDRFLQHAEIVTITGKSYRLKGRGGKDESGKDQNPGKIKGDDASQEQPG